MGHTSEPDSGMKRAAEVSEAMLSVPGYADDSMFFTVRYGHKAKVVLWNPLASPAVHNSLGTARK